MLFHYTSVDTFLKIIESGEIRVSDLSQSNDAEEGKFILDPLERDLKAAFPKADADHFRVDIFDLFDQRGALGFCMSTDGDLLSQWRGYADNGKGVALGFDPSLLLAAANSVDKSAEAKIISVKYGQSGASAASSDFIDSIAKLEIQSSELAAIRTKLVEYWLVADPSPEELKTKAGRYYQLLLNFSSRAFHFKQGAFEEEKESRLVVPVDGWDGEDTQFASRSGRISAFKTRPFGDALNMVITGPKCLASRADIERVLRRHKKLKENMVVGSSDASFR